MRYLRRNDDVHDYARDGAAAAAGSNASVRADSIPPRADNAADDDAGRPLWATGADASAPCGRPNPSHSTCPGWRCGRATRPAHDGDGRAHARGCGRGGSGATACCAHCAADGTCAAPLPGARDGAAHAPGTLRSASAGCVSQIGPSSSAHCITPTGKECIGGGEGGKC